MLPFDRSHRAEGCSVTFTFHRGNVNPLTFCAGETRAPGLGKSGGQNSAAVTSEHTYRAIHQTPVLAFFILHYQTLLFLNKIHALCNMLVQKCCGEKKTSRSVSGELGSTTTALLLCTLTSALPFYGAPNLDGQVHSATHRTDARG